MYWTLNIIALYQGTEECRCSSRNKETCGDPKNYESNCLTVCPGNKDQKCAGTNCAAKFSVGTYLEAPAGQSVYTHCGNKVDELKDLSSCDAACKAGWTGDFCDRRHCEDEEGCGDDMICNKLEVKEETFGECVCPAGKYKTAQWTCEDLPSKNVAFRKRVETVPQPETYQPEYLVDGHIIRNPSELVLRSPNEISITVHLDTLYKVQYVVVYHRPNFIDIGNGKDNLTYVVELDDILQAGSLGIPCNTYEVNMKVCTEPPKFVTCKYPDFKSMFVFLFPEIKQEVNYMAIDEIEVYAENLPVYYYVGCFGSFHTVHTMQSKNLTFDECKKFCKVLQNPMLIVGLKATEMPKPSYVGCYSEALKQENKVIGVTQGEAFKSCSVHCRMQNSIEFAIMNSIKCICGSLMNASFQVATSKCNQKCQDYVTLSCGGDGMFSLYKTFLRYEASIERHFCIDTSAGSPDCKPGRCDPGWTGPLCNKRDCSLNNGACPKDLICSKVFIGPEITSECYNAANFNRFQKTTPMTSVQMGTLMNALLILGSMLLLLIISVCCAIFYVKKKHPLIYEEKLQAVKDFKAKVGDKMKQPKIRSGAKANKAESTKDTKKAAPAKAAPSKVSTATDSTY
ncbi:hypothetical protein HELRODRAFT_178959 [Helobdella robusta]|uniref:WSC domain-containing protein n=1 Tax=Helobdella robusta TaxID=6412 RepID=T1FDY9_HELRO|nr:hypothetical protein HELRODRAFT_178959 [Helobdella robusta]ESN95778.1 hypothetical protein HELRODRAFT_178959 [Helobdella robusta]